MKKRDKDRRKLERKVRRRAAHAWKAGPGRVMDKMAGPPQLSAEDVYRFTAALEGVVLTKATVQDGTR